VGISISYLVYCYTVKTTDPV